MQNDENVWAHWGNSWYENKTMKMYSPNEDTSDADMKLWRCITPERKFLILTWEWIYDEKIRFSKTWKKSEVRTIFSCNGVSLPPSVGTRIWFYFFAWNSIILIFWISTFPVGGINCFLRTTGLGNGLFWVNGDAWEERFGSVSSTTISTVTWFGCVTAKFWVASGPTTLPTKAFYIIWFVVSVVYASPTYICQNVCWFTKKKKEEKS